jgi:hypothetical protein
MSNFPEVHDQMVSLITHIWTPVKALIHLTA